MYFLCHILSVSIFWPPLSPPVTTWSINTLKLDPVMRPSEMLEVPTLHAKVVDTSMLRHPFSETQTHPGAVTMLNSWPPPIPGAADFYSTFAWKCLWTGTWKRTLPSRWHRASDARSRSRPHCWKEKHAGFGVHHNHCELSKACRVCTLILFYFMACVYSHDCASPVCPINLQSSRLWHHEGTFCPYLPVQLSPLLWWWQWDTVRLASSSVIFHSAREYLHKAKAAVRKGKKIHHTIKPHTYRRALCTCASTFH